MKFPAVLTWRVALVRHASSFDYVREYAGPNAGEGVAAFQGSTGNAPPDYWCLSAVFRWVRKMLGKVLLRTGSCSEQRKYAAKMGALRTHQQYLQEIASKGTDAVLAWVVLSIDTKAKDDGPGLPGHAHHAMLLGCVVGDEIFGALPDGTFFTTEGNAADPKKPASRDGNGVYTGRVRGNPKELTVNGQTWKVDSSTYEFIDLEAL